MNRKFLAKVLAASLVLTATPALPGAEADAASQKTGGGYLSLVKSNRGAAENADSETLTGTAWWDGSQKGKDYILSGAGTLDLYVTFDSTADSNGYGAFSVELLSDGNKYITTNSNYDAWVNGCTGTITGALKEQASTIVVGHVYKISVKRTDNDFSVVYYDLTDDK